MDFLNINKSIQLVIHKSAIFVCDGEQIEIHIPISIDTVLDIDNLQAEDFFGNVFNKLSDPDEYPDAAGSGMSFIQINCWWFTIAPCQPNNNVNPTSRNTLDTSIATIDVEETDSGPSMVTVRLLQTLLGCIATYHIYKPGQNVCQRRKAVRDWLQKEMDDNSERVHISELPAWHQAVGRFNIRVFNSQGNVLHSKRTDSDLDG